MGKRGPPPAPSILKYLRGNPHKGPLNENEPTPDLSVDPPAWLEGVALQKWTEVAPMLVGMRVLTVADAETFGRWCCMWSRWKIAYDKCLQYGDEMTHWEPDPNAEGSLRIKYTQVAPWSSTLKNLGRDMLAIEREFGMTPSSRSTIVATPYGTPDDLTSFAAKRSG